MFTYLEELAKAYHAEQQLKAAERHNRQLALRLRRRDRETERSLQARDRCGPPGRPELLLPT